MNRTERRNERPRAALQILAERSAPVQVRDLWRQIAERVPLPVEDQGLTSTGAPRGENDFRWYSVDLVKAGWLRKENGYWSVTDNGRKALDEHSDAQAFGRAASEAYRAWDKSRQLTAEPTEAAEALLVFPDQKPVIAAASLIFQQGLRVGGSAFTEGRQVWSAATAQGLHTAFVEKPDLSPGVDFVTKLHGQLSGATDDVVILAAELLTLNVLPLSNVSATAKRSLIDTILGWTSVKVELPPVVESAFDHGAFHGGAGFNVLRWRMLNLLIEMVRHWHRLPADQRARALDDPWEWKRFILSVPGDKLPSQQEALLYLAHPGTFLPIVNAKHKQAIRSAFADQLDALSGDVDRDLFRITLDLQADRHEPVEYYDPPFVERWKPTAAPDDEEAPTRRAWLVRGSSVHGYNLVTPWLEEGWVSLSASSLRPVEPGIEKAVLKQIVNKDYAGRPAAVRADKAVEFHSFLTRMHRGDIVATTRGGEVYLGVVAGEPEFADSPQSHSRLRRAVEWRNGNAPIGFAELPQPLPAKLSSQGDLLDLTEELSLLEELLGVKPTPRPIQELSFPAVGDDLATQLLTDRAWLQEAIDLLWERRQLIFYGPPGTGKTYLATKLARHLTAPNAVKLVQFHPSYSYEDFFLGYRPVGGDDGKLGFQLRQGPFLRLVEGARTDPSTAYILIIDEINRANLAKVFGELYFLLEYRDESIGLLYSESEEQFTLPKNVFIIGTMNTADRSIALVDAAMRRRFAFVPLHPAEEPVKGLLGRWLQRHSLPAEAAQLLTALNARVKDADFAIGPSYFMRPEIHTTDNGIERVWRTSIMPLLEELHYGEGLNVSERYGLGALRGSLSASQAPPTVDFDAVPDNAPNGVAVQT